MDQSKVPRFLLARGDRQRSVRKRSLQRLGLVPGWAHPDVVLLIGQDHQHRLRVTSGAS